MSDNQITVEMTENIKKKWKPIVEGFTTDKKTGEQIDLGFNPIKDKYRKSVTAKLLENTEREYIKQGGSVLNEGNFTTGIDIVDPVLINLVRRMAPNLLAYDLVGVQPMSGPTGLIFALRSYYGSQPQGPFGVPGDARPGFNQGSALTNGNSVAQNNGVNGSATNEAMYKEPTDNFSGTGTASANDGTVAYTAYDTGHSFSTSAGETMGAGGSGDLEFNEMSISIEKTSVVAGTRALKAEYTHELAQDLKATHGLDAESELSNLLSTEILAEINRELTNTIRKIAVIAPAENQYDNGQLVTDSNGNPVLGTTGLFDLNVNSDGRWSAEKYKSLLMKVNKEANGIAKATRRGRGNFLIVSSDVASALDLSGKLDFAPAVDNNLTVDDTGNTFVGMLQNRFKVYIDPFILYDEIIVGYKGPNQMDAGMFYCPYVPLQLYKALGQDDFQPRMAFKTRYGLVSNPFTTMTRNSNLYYRKFKVAGL